MSWNQERRRALWVQLAEYREKFSEVPGRPLSRADVIDEMRQCPDVPRSFFANVGDKGLNNRLWRFEMGKKTEESTLEALRAFLSAARVTELAELVGDDDEEMLRNYNLMANTSPLAKTVFDAIAEGAYKPVPSFNHFGLQLHFARHAKAMLMQVEEHWTQRDVAFDPTFPLRPRERGESFTIRTGYAFLTTQHYLLHIFLKGRHAQDRVHYVQPSGVLSDGQPYLMRLGGPNPQVFVVPTMESQALLQVRQYQTDIAQPRPRKKPDEGEKPWPPAPAPPMGYRPTGSGMVWGVYPLGPLSDAETRARNLIREVNCSSWGHMRYWLDDAGADPAWQDEEGWTALHHAASANARTAIRLLVASGKCDYLSRTNKGLYASDLAVLGGRDYGVARLLTKKRMQQAARLGVPCRI